jgi:hypothetical protein
MTRILLLVTILLMLVSCAGKQKKEEQRIPQLIEDKQDAGYSIEILPGAENSFGYTIRKEGKPLIHQPHIPGRPGIRGFNNEQQARAAATLMIQKMKQNIMPPTLSEREIDSLISAHPGR